MSQVPELPEGHLVRAPETGIATPAHADDRELVRSVLGGSSKSWRAFLDRYSGLIYAIIRRYLYSRDADEVRTLFVDVLDSLYRRKLATYEGRATLSTWLTLVVRTEVFDHLRTRFGRREVPEAVRRMGEADLMIFRHYYVEGRSFVDVLREARALQPGWTVERLVAALRRIEERLDNRWLRRVAYDLHAQSVGAASGRLLEYLDHVRLELQQHAGAYSPDYYLMEREAQRTVERLRSLIGQLPPAEQQILTMRFERGWSARRISEELGLSGPRGVYTVIDRIVRRLKRLMGEHEDCQ